MTMELKLPDICENSISLNNVAVIKTDDSNSSWKKLIEDLFGKTPWSGEKIGTITLSLNKEGRSSVHVVDITFKNQLDRKHTFFIRFHQNIKDAYIEIENAFTIDVNSYDCFLNLLEEYPIPFNSYCLVIYRGVNVDLQEEQIENIKNRVLGHIKNNEKSKTFTDNFKVYIEKITKIYNNVERIGQIGKESYLQKIICQLPPDFIVNGDVYLYDDNKNFLLNFSNIDDNNIPLKKDEISIKKDDNGSGLTKEMFKICGKEIFLTGKKSDSAYFPLVESVSNDNDIPSIVWIEIKKTNGLTNSLFDKIKSKIEKTDNFRLYLDAKNRLKFTERMEFTSDSCISTYEFQKFINEHNVTLTTYMRHNDLHVGNLLVSKTGLCKIIDVGDLDRNLAMSDIARLETSFWFEVSKELKKEGRPLSKKDVKQILNLATKEKPKNIYLFTRFYYEHFFKYRVIFLSEILKALRQGFREGINTALNDNEIGLAYTIQILLYQRYCLLDGEKEIPEAFNEFACYWLRNIPRHN